jgi:hypothetical protein
LGSPINRIADCAGWMGHAKVRVWSGFCVVWGLTRDFAEEKREDSSKFFVGLRIFQPSAKSLVGVKDLGVEDRKSMEGGRGQVTLQDGG